MPTAPADHQHRLLEVQDLDLRMQQGRHRRATLPLLAELSELTARLSDLEDERIARTTAVSDLRREVTKAEDDVETVRTRAARDNARLASGTGSPKDLQALQSELEVLERRREALEDVELEVMDRLETAEKTLESAREQVEAIASQVRALESDRDAQWAQIDAELGDLAIQRTAVADGIDAALVALYTKLRDANGGIGAAALRHGECEGCRMRLNPADVQSIQSRPADAVVRCEECGRILVRGVTA